MNGQTLSVETEYIWRCLNSFIDNPYATAGLMGCMYMTNGLNPDLGEYSDTREFIMNKKEYGLMGWSYWGDKQSLCNIARRMEESIKSLGVQLELIREDLTGASFANTMRELKDAEGLYESCTIVLDKLYGGRIRKTFDTYQKNMAWLYATYYYNAYSSMIGEKYNPVEKWVKITKNVAVVHLSPSVFGKKMMASSKGDVYRFAGMSKNINWRGIFVKDKVGWVSVKRSEMLTHSREKQASL